MSSPSPLPLWGRETLLIPSSSQQESHVPSSSATRMSLRYQKDLPQAGRDEWVMRSESENSEPTSPICEGGPEAYSFLVLS